MREELFDLDWDKINLKQVIMEESSAMPRQLAVHTQNIIAICARCRDLTISITQNNFAQGKVDKMRRE